MEKGKKVISIVIFFITVVLIALIFIQFRTVEKTNSIGINSMQEEELRTEILEWKNKYEEVAERLNDNNLKIEEYTNIIQNNQQASELLNTELNEYNMLMGKTDVTGSGVLIVMTDSYERTYSSSNLVYLVNELKYAGAEAISINGQRITNFSDIVTIQEKYMLINGERISGPYEVKAIGNKDRLLEILNFPVDGYIDNCKNQGYTISINAQDNIQIPAYSQEIVLKYIKEAE